MNPASVTPKALNLKAQGRGEGEHPGCDHWQQRTYAEGVPSGEAMERLRRTGLEQSEPRVRDFVATLGCGM
jgi:hypothetical protein